MKTLSLNKVRQNIMAGALSVALALGAATAFAQPAFADSTDGYSQEVEFYVDGKSETPVVLDVDNPYVIRDKPVGYIYRTDKGWFVCSVTNYIPLQTIIEKYGQGKTWNTTSEIKFLAYSKNSKGTYDILPYDKYSFTYATLDQQTKFFPTLDKAGAVALGDKGLDIDQPVLAFNYKVKQIEKAAEATEAEIESEGDYLDNTRFVMGLSRDHIDQTSDWNMGKRFPSSITRMTLFSM